MLHHVFAFVTTHRRLLINKFPDRTGTCFNIHTTFFLLLQRSSMFCDSSPAFCWGLIQRWLVSLPVSVRKCKWHQCCVTSNSRSKTPLNWEQCTALTRKASKQRLLRQWHVHKIFFFFFIQNTRRFPAWCFFTCAHDAHDMNAAAKSQTETTSRPKDWDATRWSSELRSPQPFLRGVKERSCARHDGGSLRARQPRPTTATHCVSALRQRLRHRAVINPTSYW